MRWHHDEIGRNCLRKPGDFIEGRCTTEHIALRRRDAAFTCHFLELFERGLFSGLLVRYQGKWDHRRRRSHKVACVIELANMREVYRSAKTPSQLPGDLDGLHRHFREIDWDDDVLNVQLFHAHSMKWSQPPGSALLAKAKAFFALGLATMQSVPDYGTEKTKGISDRTRDRDERNGRRWIERFSEVNRLDHVRPKNEIGGGN